MKSNARKTESPPTVGEELRDHARFARLTGYAATAAARALVNTVLDKHTAHARLAPNAAREKHRNGVAALLAELLCAEEGYWLYRSTKSTEHTGGLVGARIYERVRRSLIERGWVEYRPVVYQWLPDVFEKQAGGYRYEGPRVGGDGRVGNRYAGRWRATPALIELAASHGITVENARKHFEFKSQLPKDPLVARTASWRDEYGQKIAGTKIRIRHNERTRRLEQDVKELNEYLDKHELEGGKHEGFRRIFQKADDPAFDWNMGGRLYSLPPGEGNYQQLNRDKQRLKMTIDGLPVAELDIRACFLTLLHAWHGMPLDITQDPYVLPGLGEAGRDAVKLWFVATFGSVRPITRWPRELLKNHEKRGGNPLDKKRYSVALIGEKALAAYPVLQHWGVPGPYRRVRDWSDLMFAESEIIIATMRELMIKHDVPSYPVHDSLIVPAKYAPVAHGVLVEQFTKHAGQPAYVDIKLPRRQAKGS